MVKNGCDQSSHGTLKLAVPQKYLHAGKNSVKLKSWFNDFWWACPKMAMAVRETVKFAASYKLNWFFELW